jgi:hypothetical protein
MFEAETTASYRDLFGAAGSAGGWVESVRETVPVASAGAVLIRIVQSIFEPLLAFGRRPSFIEDGSISIWGLALVGAALILLRYWLTFIRRLVIMIIEKPRVDREVTQLYTFCLVFIFPVAGFSFIQSRYLYPVTVLMLVAAVVGVPGRGVALGHPKTSGVGHSPDAPVDY